AVVIVHHCGVETSRPRGHTSLTGAADAQHSVKRHGNTSTLTVEFMKDGEEGAALSARIEIVELGLNKHGNPITSCVLVEAETVDVAKVVKLRPNEQTMFSILHTAKRLSTDEWNERAREAGIGLKRRADLYDIRTRLKDRGHVVQFGDEWSVKHDAA